MRKVTVGLVVLAALVAMAIPVAAQVPGPGGPYNSAFTVQNLEAQDATCVFSLYDSSGTAAYDSSEFTVPGEGSYFVYVGNLTVSDGQYSAVISCDREVAAVANMTDPSRAASYSGFRTEETGDTLYAPGVYKNYYGFTSNVVVQNATSDPIDVDLEIYQPGSSTPVETFSETSVPGNTSVSFDQGDLASDGLYSAKIVATGEVAGVADIWNNAGQLYSYNAFGSGATVAYAPVLMSDYYGFNTALTVQNLGSNSTDVTVTYSGGITHTETVAAGSSQLFYTPNEGLGSGWIGSAKVESDGEPIVALINEEGALNRAASYSGFTGGSTTANAPIVLKDYYGYSTSITCQNIGDAATDITITYSDPSATSTTESNVPVNGTVLFYQPNVAGLPTSFNGSAIITADEEIVCIVNENQVDNPASEDWLLAYNAIVQ